MTTIYTTLHELTQILAVEVVILVTLDWWNQGTP